MRVARKQHPELLDFMPPQRKASHGNLSLGTICAPRARQAGSCWEVSQQRSTADPQPWGALWDLPDLLEVSALLKGTNLQVENSQLLKQSTASQFCLGRWCSGPCVLPSPVALCHLGIYSWA